MSTQRIWSALVLLMQKLEISCGDCKSWHYSRRYRKKVLHTPGSCKVCMVSVRFCYTDLSLNLHPPGPHVPGWKNKVFSWERENWIKNHMQRFYTLLLLNHQRLNYPPLATTSNTFILALKIVHFWFWENVKKNIKVRYGLLQIKIVSQFIAKL